VLNRLQAHQQLAVRHLSSHIQYLGHLDLLPSIACLKEYQLSGCVIIHARSEVTEVQMHEVDLLSAYLLEMVRQHYPVGFLGQMYKQL